MTDLITKNDIELIEHKEPRIDSRLVAKKMGIKHLSLISLVNKNKSELRELGTLPFQIETCKHRTGASKIKYVLLNEIQFDFISRLIRGKNYKDIVRFKLDVTKAFAASRKHEAIKRESLAYYHESRDSLSTMQGVEKYHYINLARAENKMIGLSTGKRKNADEVQLGMLICLQQIETSVFKEIDSPTEAIREVSRRFNALANLISPNDGITRVQ
jgi:phage regulator Rha-like protein